MLHFLLPNTHRKLYQRMHLVPPPMTDPQPVISNSLSHYLYDIKRRIDVQEDKWDVYKRFTNPYEYIHTVVPGKRKSVCQHRPLSRSYFKMIELVRFFHLFQHVRLESSMNSFHLAEGPGGFIEALADMRNDNTRDRYVGMTIESRGESGVPGWRKSQHFLQEHRDTVYIETGATGTGDILSMANLNHCIAKYGNRMDLITGDGGFDFSMNFNDQEIHITRLLFAQMVYAVCLQKRGGSFILKLFDCFMPQTLDVLALLSSFYDRVYITKPQTSRFANSEKYLVCKNFLLHPSETEPRNALKTAFSNMMATSELQAFRFLQPDLPIMFLSRIEEFNAIFGQQQIENIYYTLSLMDNHKYKTDTVDALMKSNVNKCVQWCEKYGVSYHGMFALAPPPGL